MQHKSLAHTLDEALARLHDETELKQYLESCPDNAQALQPLLDVARILKHEAHRDLPADMHEWLMIGREEITTLTPRFLSTPSRRALPPVARLPSGIAPVYGAVLVLQRLFHLNRLAVAFVGLAILLFFLTTSFVDTTSAHSVPGDMLYSWKLARETVILAMTPDPEQRSLLRLHYASQRIAEFETLVTNEQSMDEGQVERALDLLNIQVYRALNEARHSGNSDVVQQQLETLLTHAATRIESAMVRSQTQHDQHQQKTLHSAREKMQTLKQDLSRLAVTTVPLDATPTPTVTNTPVDPATIGIHTQTTPTPTSSVAPNTTSTRTIRTETATSTTTRTARPTLSPTITRMDINNVPPTSTSSSSPTQMSNMLDRGTSTATTSQVLDDQSLLPTWTATPTATPSDTATPTATPSDTATPTPGDTTTATPSDTTTATPSDTTTPTPGDTATPTPGDTATPTPGDTATPTPGDTATPTPGDTATPTPGDTTTPTPGDTATPGHTSTPTPFETNISGAVRPILECVAVSTDDWLIAFFGYENLSDAPVVIPTGPKNIISPGRYDGLQPEEFILPKVIEDRPGRTGFYPDGPFAFTLSFRATEQVIWSLDGHIATASQDSPRCGVLLDVTTIDDLPMTDTPDPELPLVDDVTSIESERPGSVITFLAISADHPVDGTVYAGTMRHLCSGGSLPPVSTTVAPAHRPAITEVAREPVPGPPGSSGCPSSHTVDSTDWR